MRSYSMKLVFGVLLSCVQVGLVAQDLFIDPRDGNSYSTLQVEGKTWLAENLRYATDRSYFPRFARAEETVEQGNFYPLEQAQSVCPTGWHTATAAEWFDYFEAALLFAHDTSQVLREVLVETYQQQRIKEQVLSTRFRDGSRTIAFFEQDNRLPFQETGWVEGLRFEPPGVEGAAHNATSWAPEVDTSGLGQHIHYASYGYLIHYHRHHVLDKPKRIRWFTVKCVQNTDAD